MNHRLLLGVCLGLLGATAACTSSSPTAGSDPTAPVSGPAAGGDGAPVAVTLGLPYRPDVQFTPLYVAEANGHYAANDLAVTHEYGDESSFVRLVAAGRMAATIASGEQVILAKADGIPVRYVATWYARFPGVVFSLDPEIVAPADLVGRKVGLPAPSGASYIGWQALLAANDIEPRDVTTEIVGFEQLSAVLEGRVNAAVGYAANEPVQLRAEGFEPSVIAIADSFNLVSNGLVVSDASVEENPEMVGRLVAAFLGGIRETLDDPDAAFEVAVSVVPEAGDPAVRGRQRQVLEESMRYWDAPQLGAIDRAQWEASQDFLRDIGLVAEPVPVDALIEDRFVRDAAASAAGPRP